MVMTIEKVCRKLYRKWRKVGTSFANERRSDSERYIKENENVWPKPGWFRNVQTIWAPLISSFFLIITKYDMGLRKFKQQLYIFEIFNFLSTLVQSVCKYFFFYFRIFLFRYQIFISDFFCH